MTADLRKKISALLVISLLFGLLTPVSVFSESMMKLANHLANKAG
jgi:hypothetical protein